MTAPALTPTEITFPTGELTVRATVLAVTPPVDDRVAVIVDRTPFHPVDHRWPDQGADQGTMRIYERAVEVLDCVLAAADTSSGEIFLGADIPVRRGTEGWAFLVAHLIEAAAMPYPGDEVELEVDPEHRRALSAAHTGCHVAALALNEVLADRWRKEVATDGRGNPDFDAAANTTSLHRPYASTDTYRLGKSLRKKGFDAEGLAEELPALEHRANDLLGTWVQGGGPVSWQIDGPQITDLRVWSVTLPDGGMTVPCGGTHLTDIAELGSLRVSLSLDGEELRMDAQVG